MFATRMLKMHTGRSCARLPAAAQLESRRQLVQCKPLRSRFQCLSSPACRFVVQALSSSPQKADLPEPGTPEAPPQVPPTLETLPGTTEAVENVVPPVENVVPPVHGDTAVEPAVVAQESGVPPVHGDTAVEPAVVAKESGTGDLAGPDGAAVADIAATVQPLMDTVGGSATAADVEVFKQNWAAFDSWMREQGFYNFAEEGTEVTEAGAVKKACVECGRTRPEAIYDIDRAWMKSWIGAYHNLRRRGAETAALGDRKAVNAIRRLEPWLGLATPIGLGQGGAPTFLDVMRVMFSTQVDINYPDRVLLMEPGFLIDGAAVLGSALSVLQKAPSPEAQARYAEAEANTEREREAAAERRVQRDAERGFGSRAQPFQRRQPEMRPGDWNCESCGQHNFARNMQCYKCDALRPASVARFDGERSSTQYSGEGLGKLPENFREGDWMCPTCRAHNFRSKFTCYRCSGPRPEEASTSSRASSVSSFGGNPFGAQPAHAPRTGDWTCSSCGGNNFARRRTCFKCDAPRSEDSQVVSTGFEPPRGFRSDRGGSSFRSERPAPVVRPGDWKCGSCSAHNFARNEDCFRCGTSSVTGIEMTPTVEGGRYRGGSSRGSSDSDSSFPSRRSSAPRSASAVREDVEW